MNTTLVIDRLLISPTGYAHVPGGCVHYVDDPQGAGWGWIPDPLLGQWAGIGTGNPLQATDGNTARTATKRCHHCTAALHR